MPKPKSINKEFLELSTALDVKKFAESVRGVFHNFVDYRREGKNFTLHGTLYWVPYLVI